VAHELTQLSRFTPRLRSALQSTKRASAQLGAALAAARVPTPHAVRGTPKQIALARAEYRAKARAAASAQAAAVLAYCTRLGPVLSRLRALQAPPVMSPTLQAQIEELVATRRAGLALGHELLEADLSNVPLLSHRFSAAARSAASVAAQRAQIAAIKAFNARVRQTSAIAARIRAEFSRVQAEVG
jgi:hypothetical protein